MLPIAVARYLIPPGVKNMKDLVMVRMRNKKLLYPNYIKHHTNIGCFQWIRGEINQVFEDTQNKMQTQKRSIFYELRDNPKLPLSEKSRDRLEKEGVLLVMAGITPDLEISMYPSTLN
jgi:hypothetical protein